MQSEQRGPARSSIDVRSRAVLRWTAAFAGLFGALTIGSGGRALVGGAEVGAAVPFVLWFNFLAGFAYIVAAYGLWRARHWSPMLALAITICTGLVFIAFGVHVIAGGAFESRTVIAMTLRTSVWGAIAALSGWMLTHRSERGGIATPTKQASGKS